MRVFPKLTVTEIKLLLREPLPTFFSLLFPTVLVVILGCIPAFREPSADLGGSRVIDLYVGIAAVLSLATLGLQVVPTVLAGYREKGILRRLATTPVRPSTLLSAQLAAALLTAVVAAALAIAVGRIAFDVPLPAHFAGFVLAYLLAALGVFAIGLFIAALAPTGKAANAIGTLLFFPSMFFAGLWTPREVFPEVLQRIGDFTPLGAGERAVHEAMTGHWPSALSATVLVAYLVVFGLAAGRLFRWS
ncbi:ABC transporter permease [Paractinoplanes ferrugineus]|uniref:Transport permease protein n=1 Tax=Paractinoplanes ferrugineus TaxID=113564 RepID=A0A919MF08_9ACTN|nr:ABC transporter permease [Actinoplanes ferrugineus]GIE12259.1 transport permease protein [Actinoplanes ferrugineus]